MTSPTRDVFQLELDRRGVVVSETNPVTGGVELSAGGVTIDVGASADLILDTQGLVTATALRAPLFGSPSLLPPHSFYPKRRGVGSFGTVAATLFANTGSVTSADDTTDPYVGNTAASAYPANFGTSPTLTMASGAATTVVPNAFLSSALDMTGMNVYAAIKIVGPTSPGSVTLGVRLYSGTTPSAASANYHSCVRVDFVPTQEWQIVSFAIEDFAAAGTGATLTAITHAGFRIGGLATTATITLGGFFACPKALSKGCVVIGFDDGRADAWTDASNELVKRGIPATLYPGALAAVLRDGVDQFQMAVAHYKKLEYLHGWQVASQAYTTENPVGYTTDQAMQDLAELKFLQSAMATHGGADGSYYSNIGPTDLTWKPAFRQAFRTMRGYTISSSAQITAKQALPETHPPSDRNYIKALGVDLASHTLSDLTTYAGYAAASKGIALFIFHGVSAANGTQFAKFTGLLDYIDANRATLEPCTFERVLHVGNAQAI